MEIKTWSATCWTQICPPPLFQFFFSYYIPHIIPARKNSSTVPTSFLCKQSHQALKNSLFCKGVLSESEVKIKNLKYQPGKEFLSQVFYKNFLMTKCTKRHYSTKRSYMKQLWNCQHPRKICCERSETALLSFHIGFTFFFLATRHHKEFLSPTWKIICRVFLSQRIFTVIIGSNYLPNNICNKREQSLNPVMEAQNLGVEEGEITRKTLACVKQWDHLLHLLTHFYGDFRCTKNSLTELSNLFSYPASSQHCSQVSKLTHFPHCTHAWFTNSSANEQATLYL